MALASVLMKCLESIDEKHLCDDMQFAYKQNRCIDYAVTTLIHVLYAHIDKVKPTQGFFLWIFQVLSIPSILILPCVNCLM